MPPVGPRLRAEREKRDLRLVDVAMATRVGAHHLSALEYGDFAALPDDRSVIGFVRAYAEHLGLDPNEVAEDLSRELAAARPAGVERDDRVEAPAAAGPPAMRPGFGMRLAGAAAAVAVVLIVAVWWWLAGGAADEPPVAAARPAAGAAEMIPQAQALQGTEEEEAANPVEAAPVAAEAAGAPAPEDEAGRLTVPDFGVGTAVVERLLVGEGDNFTEGQRVWFWTRVNGGAAGETVHHVWIRGGREVADVALPLGGPRWRTQSRKTLPPGSAGRWAVEARDAAGRVLARSEFRCAPRP